jgi:branched-chain amino acid transport system ATP-binding protein
LPQTDLSLQGVTAGYGSMHILHEIDLHIRAGERLSLVGRNGAGKTTLMLAIMGLCRLHAGKISLEGRDISRSSTFRRARAGLGLVPQTRDVFPSLSVEDNLIAGLKSGHDDDVNDAYELFPRLRERRANLAGNLSGGEQQMLSIARTLLGRPRILLLDEPLEGLAPVICNELMEVFQKLSRQEHALSIVLVEQHINIALGFAERIVVLDHGRIAFDGTSIDARSSGILERSLGVGTTTAPRHQAAHIPEGSTT